MDKVYVEKEELLKILKNNREDHKTVFEEAIEGYRKEVIRLLEKVLKDAKDGKKITTDVELEEPISRVRYYDVVIGMLEMTIEEKVLITPQQYKNYVMDEWAWMDNFVTSAANYVSSSSSSSSILASKTREFYE